MTKLIASVLCALIAGGMAWVMQGAGVNAVISTWAICGAVAGLVGSFIIGA